MVRRITQETKVLALIMGLLVNISWGVAVFLGGPVAFYDRHLAIFRDIGQSDASEMTVFVRDLLMLAMALPMLSFTVLAIVCLVGAFKEWKGK
jgi:hypothetical protein